MASRPPDEPEEQARQRWMVIQMMRIMGFSLVILGLLMVRDVVDLAGEVNHLTGYGFVVIGLLDGFLMPIYLARKWSSRSE
jgi:hypothetical protein